MSENCEGANLLSVLQVWSGSTFSKHGKSVPAGFVGFHNSNPEQLLLTQHPELRRHRRLLLLSLGGQLLPLSTLVTPAEHQGFIAMPDPGYGSNFPITTPDVHNLAVSVAKRAIGDAQRHAQTRLLLRGEPGFRG